MTWDQIRLSDRDAASNRTESFAALIQRQSGFVFRVAFCVLHNAQDAEDVAQEAFLKLHRKGRWEEIKDERAYLARVTWRLAITKRMRRHDSTLAPNFPSPVPTPEELVTQSDWRQRIHLLIDTLPEELRDPLLLSMTEELKSHEIADVLGVPEGTVRNRLFRARQLLKQKLKPLMESGHGQ